MLLAIADDEGELGAWPSHETLAEKANVSTRTIKRYLSELVELGELEITYQGAPTGKNFRSNLYRVTVCRTTTVLQDDVGLQDDLGSSSRPVDGLGSLKNPLTIKRARQLPSDWEPNENHKQFCEKFDLDLEEIAESFKTWATATGRKYVDWDAGFRNWLNNSVKWSKTQQPKKQKPAYDWMNNR